MKDKKMKSLKSTSISEILNFIFRISLFLLIIHMAFPAITFGRLDFNVPKPGDSRYKVAIPDFKNLSSNRESPELSTELPKVISNDLDLSGYFIPMDKKAFLDSDGAGITAENINFRNWTLIGTDLLIKGAYSIIGKNVEVDIRAFEPFKGKQIFGKRYLEKIDDYRLLMHRAGNDIFLKYTGFKGIFLSKFLFDNKSTGNKEIYICDFDGYNLKKITNEKAIAQLPRWSPGGDGFSFVLNRDGYYIPHYMNIATGKIKKLSDKDGYGASWHPNGGGIDLTLREKWGYNDSLDPVRTDIYSADINGGNLKKLTNNQSDDLSPSRSPDGKKLVFSSDRAGKNQIYIKDLTTGIEERITYIDKNSCVSPVWSSQNKIAFVAVEKDISLFDIYTMNPDGTGLRRLTEGNRDNWEPCWSPDGRYIVFSSNRDGKYHLYIMNENGFNQRRVTFFTGEERNPSWSPF
jgi:TolB protein